MDVDEPWVPPRRICVVCGRTLDYTHGTGYFHGIGHEEGSDHPAIPIDPGEAPEQDRPRCDFCFADDPHYVVPARSFNHGIGISAGDWAACELCAREIERDSWNGLLRRVLASWEARYGEPMEEPVREGLRRMYRGLRKNITGAIRFEGP